MSPRRRLRLLLPLLLAVAALVLALQWRGRTQPTASTPPPSKRRLADAPRPPPPPAGALTIRGRVLDGSTPIAEAAVFATQPPEELDLSGLPSGCRDAQPLLDATCPEAQRRIVERVTNHGAEPPALARALSLPDGSFVLTGLAAGQYRLWAERAGVGIGETGDVAAGAQDALVYLEKTRVITGKVVGDNGQPFPGASVTALAPRLGRFFDGESDQAGNFSIGPVPLGFYNVVATAEGKLAAHADFYFGGPPPLLQLATPVSLSGRVVQGDRRVPGATVKDGAVTTTTDAEGHFALEDLRPGKHVLDVSTAQDFATEVVELAPEKSTDDVEIRLVAGVLLSGRVHDVHGRPIAGATVSVQSRSTTTDAEGRYRLPAFAAGGEANVRVNADGYCSEEDDRAFPEGEQTVDFKLVPAVSLSGRVVDEHGRPVANAAVLADAVQHRGGIVYTDEEGRFELDGLEEGVEYSLEATLDNQYISARTQVLPPAQNLRIALFRGRTVRGKVVDAHGQPVHLANIMVTAVERDRFSLHPGGITDEEGRFTLTGLPYEQSIQIDAYLRHVPQSAKAEIEAGKADVESLLLRLPELYPVTGRVVMPTGEPVSKAFVRLHPGEDATDSAVSAEDGRFELQVEAPGEYSLSALDSTNENACENLAVRVPSSEPLTVVLQPRSWVRGKVLRTNGRPVTHFRINGEAYSDPDGAFKLPEPSAKTPYAFSAIGLAMKWVPLGPGDARGAPLQVVLEEGHAVTGRVVDAESGAPLPDARLEVDSGQPPSAVYMDGEDMRTGPSGEFTLPHVTESFQLHIFKRGYSDATWTVTPEARAFTVRMSPSRDAPP